LIRSNDEAASSARTFGLASVVQDLDIAGVDSDTLTLFMNCLIPHVWVGCGILSALMPLMHILLIVKLVFLIVRLDILILLYKSDLVLDDFRLVILRFFIGHAPFTLLLAALNYHGNLCFDPAWAQLLTGVTPHHKGRVIVREPSDLLYSMSRNGSYHFKDCDLLLQLLLLYPFFLLDLLKLLPLPPNLRFQVVLLSKMNFLFDLDLLLVLRDVLMQPVLRLLFQKLDHLFGLLIPLASSSIQPFS